MLFCVLAQRFPCLLVAGKSSIALRFVSNEFRPYSESTIGASFTSKTMEIPETADDNDTSTRSVSLKIWDTAGQEKYHSLASMYYRGAASAIIVYDICNRVSFRALKMWVNEVRMNGPKDCVLVVCGNKSDLASHRQVPLEEVTSYAEEVGALYMETSARDNSNIEDLFLEVGKRVLALRGPRESSNIGAEIDTGSVNLGYVQPSSSKCC